MAAPGTNPGRVQRRVAMTTGSHTMQVYWFESGSTRVLGLLPFVWQVEERRWVTRQDSFVLPPHDDNPQFGTWSLTCLKCHATHARPRVDYEGNALRGADTQVGEFGIGCESCHGPGEAHVQKHGSPATRYTARHDDAADPTITNPARLPFDRATMVCGQCHGQHDYRFNDAAARAWFVNGFRYRPGDDLNADRTPKFQGEGQFWSDGLIRVAGREYNALLRSRCHTEGHTTCTTCHVLHQPVDDARPVGQWADDQLRNEDEDRSCRSCHAAIAQQGTAHTHHAEGSSGARCVNCHMPRIVYGVLDLHRSHRIDSPHPARDAAAGRPHACTLCHVDRTLAWAAESMRGFWGAKYQAPQVRADKAPLHQIGRAHV